MDSGLGTARRSITDALTGLANRHGASLMALRQKTPIGAAYLDVDGFRTINHFHGYDFGDELLRQVAFRLKMLGSPIFAVSRVGDDEFVVLFHNLSAEAAQHVERRIASVFRDELTIGDTRLNVTASVGIAALDAAFTGTEPTEWREASPDSALLKLLLHADMAQHCAKADGGNSARFFDTEMERSYIRQKLVQDCFEDIGKDDHFWLAYQAIVDIKTGTPVGAEALARLTCPNLGSVSPAEFIPVAEKNGLINPLGEFVFSEALKELSNVHDRLPPGFVVSVNVSPVQLRSDRIIRVALDAASRHADIAARLRLEITESGLIEDDSLVRLRHLKDAGYSIAIDDFGSEFASLQSVARVKPDVLKLDRTFASSVVGDGNTSTIIRHVIRMANDLDILVVSEGVETERELAAIAATGCHYGQGFLWGAPARGLERFCR